MENFLMIDGVKKKLSPDQIRMIKNLNIIEKVNFDILNEDDWFYIETIHNIWLAKGNILNHSNKKGLHYNFKRDFVQTNYLPLCNDKNSYKFIRKATEEEINNLFEKFPEYNPNRKILNWKDILTCSGWYCNGIGNPILLENADPFKIPVILFPSEEEAVANWALSKLLFLRDLYNGNWKADWNELSQNKYIIHFVGDSIETGTNYICYKILAFKDKKTRENFIKNNRDLILKAKKLLQC